MKQRQALGLTLIELLMVIVIIAILATLVAVAVYSAASNKKVMTSPDGVTWTTRNSATNDQWHGVAYGDGKFVAVSVTGKFMTAPCQ